MQPILDTLKKTDTDSLEIGHSSWNQDILSIRSRHDLDNGHFTPRNSPELPLAELPELIEFALSSRHVPDDLKYRIMRACLRNPD